MDNTIEGIMAAEEQAYREGIEVERDRIRPLLERCEALALAQLRLHQRLPRPDAEAVALFGNLLADLRRELGKDG